MNLHGWNFCVLIVLYFKGLECNAGRSKRNYVYEDLMGSIASTQGPNLWDWDQVMPSAGPPITSLVGKRQADDPPDTKVKVEEQKQLEHLLDSNYNGFDESAGDETKRNFDSLGGMQLHDYKREFDNLGGMQLHDFKRGFDTLGDAQLHDFKRSMDKRFLSSLGGGELFDYKKRGFDTLGGAQLHPYKRYLSSIGSGNGQKRYFDTLGGAQLHDGFKRYFSPLGGANLIDYKKRSFDTLGGFQLVDGYKRSNLLKRQLSSLGGAELMEYKRSADPDTHRIKRSEENMNAAEKSSETENAKQ